MIAWRMVQCPKWANLPPISLAYIKGAVRRRPVQCFDLNHDLLKRAFPTTAGTSITRVLHRHRPLHDLPTQFWGLRGVCGTLSQNYAPIFDEWVDRLKDFGVVGFSVYQENVVMSAILARRLRREHGIVCLAGGPTINMDEPRLYAPLAERRYFRPRRVWDSRGRDRRAAGTRHHRAGSGRLPGLGIARRGDGKSSTRPPNAPTCAIQSAGLQGFRP